MIVFHVSIRCNGCGATTNPQASEVVTFEDAANVAAFAHATAIADAGWTAQDKAHWCPNCTRVLEKQAS